jgi:beta-glucosidase-like glycosyl hydrolase
LAAAEITEEDLYPYKRLTEKGNLEAIMVSHLITFGEVNSEGKPSVSSERIVDGIREMGFNGLIVTDEINMMGVSKFYDTRDEMYVDIFKAGPDLVLNFFQDPNEIYHMIKVVKQAVKDGIISEERIDASVKRILEAKGFNVMYE